MASVVATRVAIGLTLIAVFGGLLTADYLTGHGYGVIALVVLLVGGGVYEYAAMAGTDSPLPVRLLTLGGMAYALVRGLGHAVHPDLHLLQAPLVVGLAYWIGFQHLRGAPSIERFRGLAAAALGFFYIPVLGSFALDVRFHFPPGEPVVGIYGFLYVVAIAKGTDIFAFFVGRTFGKTKLVPSVSPGKTVAGFVGAVGGAVVITGVFVWLTPLGKLIPLPWRRGWGSS